MDDLCSTIHSTKEQNEKEEEEALFVVCTNLDVIEREKKGIKV